MSAREDLDVAVVGAGAAGMLAGIFAAREGARTALLETRAKPGAKIRVSGGGRCNVLPSVMELEDFHTSGSPRTMRNILFSWPLADVRAFFESDLGVELYVEPDTGKVFPRSDDAREIVAALLDAVEAGGAELIAPFRVVRLTAPDAPGGTFRLASDAGEVLRARTVILATGGLSLPKTGSDGGGWEMARALGHSIAPTHPALVPLRTSEVGWTELSGISCRVTLTARRGDQVLEARTGALLFTHRGFSGPVVLDVSHRRTQPGGEAVTIEATWRPGEVDWEAELRRGGRGTVAGLVREHLPRRLANRLLLLSGVAGETRLAELSRDARRALEVVLQACPLPVDGDEGYRTAEVTGGGVPLAEVRTKTLESRCAEGLYLCGEMLDTTGRIGGFNFLWAWVTGRKAGRAAARAAGTSGTPPKRPK